MAGRRGCAEDGTRRARGLDGEWACSSSTRIRTPFTPSLRPFLAGLVVGAAAINPRHCPKFRYGGCGFARFEVPTERIGVSARRAVAMPGLPAPEVRSVRIFPDGSASWKEGDRFSMNAAMPSFWSCVANVEWKIRRSNRISSDRLVSEARLTASLVIMAAGLDKLAILLATDRASSRSVSAGTATAAISGVRTDPGEGVPIGEPVGGVDVAEAVRLHPP